MINEFLKMILQKGVKESEPKIEPLQTESLSAVDFTAEAFERAQARYEAEYNEQAPKSQSTGKDVETKSAPSLSTVYGPSSVRSARRALASEITADVENFIDGVEHAIAPLKLATGLGHEVAQEILEMQLAEIRGRAISFILKARRRLGDLPMSATEIESQLLEISAMAMAHIKRRFREVGINSHELDSYLQSIADSVLARDPDQQEMRRVS